MATSSAGPESALELPPRPAALSGRATAVWREPVSIDTYDLLPPDRYPMYLDHRVYQGSSGRVYPMPFHERVAQEKHPQRWDAVHLENPWIRLMVLPELGGRIHVGLDRTTGYDFFYRNNVIKPALVGLAGPWISGGVEFNWPQHHRPATYLPTDVVVEEAPDGSVTVWCSDHDPFHRLKGMHGITLHPDRAVVELKVRLHNRTEDVRTFLWWANVAARVNDDYQSFFPTDVEVVADHARRATTGFPRATTPYYGVDYPARVDAEHPDADRLDWYRNIPVPTSYMCVGSKGDFFGGYDHGARAGFVHWADHHVAPGKKQWTWGNDRFGWAWDANLTDTDGPYVELMAGVYTDNQPDFAFLAPGETKTFSQYWYPISEIGTVQQATTELALHHEVRTLDDGSVEVELGLGSTRVRDGAALRLEGTDGRVLWSEAMALDPRHPVRRTVTLPSSADLQDSAVVVVHGDVELLRWTPTATVPGVVEPATEPPAPEELGSVEELYLVGLHLSQYRHATRPPEPYWQEALARDPGDSRSATALAAAAYGRGELDGAEQLLRRAVARTTSWNANPYDGEPHYRLGLVLERLGRPDEAYEVWAKAAWTRAWRAPAHLAMAFRLCSQGAWAEALDLLEAVARDDSDNLAARDLAVVCLRRLGRTDEADARLAATLALDPLDWWARHLDGDPLTCDARTARDLALQLARAGLLDEALEVLDAVLVDPERRTTGGQEPLLHHHRAVVLDRLGRSDEATLARRLAGASDPTWCFPHGLDDEAALRRSLDADPSDGAAAGLLGHLLYGADRPKEAVAAWERAVAADPADAVCWRNLGLAAFNVGGDAAEAVRCFDAALLAAPSDSRLRYERDQLARRLADAPDVRLARLEAHPDQVAERDDLTIEHVHLLVTAGQVERALDVLGGRRFQPWEGGEGQALAAWERTQLAHARRLLDEGRAAESEDAVRAALDPPLTLGEGPHLLANRADLHLALGDALAAQDQGEAAATAWWRAATSVGDFVDMAPQAYGEKTFLSATAWRRLGRETEADALLTDLRDFAVRLGDGVAGVDYFATSLPALLLFDDDLQQRRRATARLLLAQAELGLGHPEAVAPLLVEVLQHDPSRPAALDLAALLTRTTADVHPDAAPHLTPTTPQKDPT